MNNLVSSSAISIKYEYPYSEPGDSQSPASKRRRLEQSQGLVERQHRVDSQTPPLGSEELAVILAQATASATQHLEPQLLQQQQLLLQELGSPDVEERSCSQNTQMKVELGLSSPTNLDCTNRFTSDPYLYMRILSLPILESLSTQILSILAEGPYDKTINIVTIPESELGQAYATLRSLFDQTKKIYSQQSSFLSADMLNIMESEHRSTIRTTNLATFVSSVFCGQDVGFLELNDHFIKTFTPDGAPLQRECGELYLNLKTQMYVSAVSQEEQERTREDILDDFFPPSLHGLLEDRHPGEPLAETEVEFLQAFTARRDYLASSPIDVDSIQKLSEMFAWEDFLKQLGAYISKGPLITPFMERHALTIPKPPSNGYTAGYAIPSIEDDIRAQVELAAEQTLESLSSGASHGFSGGSRGYSYSTQNGSYQPDYSNVSLPKEQTAPTQVLYERARQAAAHKSNPNNTRQPGLPSQRRPWSGDEERALMAGLDQVKGPHWSQILALYGPRGRINEILKDRNQVQLKDKARNLKLFFLKSGIEVPYYLKSVTGELKTRAPTQAAKREAEERARLASAEEQTRMNGVMALTGGLQNLAPGTATSPPRLSRENSSSSSLTSSEVLHVTDSPNERGFECSPPAIEDENLRQSLIAATASAKAGRTISISARELAA